MKTNKGMILALALCSLLAISTTVNIFNVNMFRFPGIDERRPSEFKNTRVGLKHDTTVIISSSLIPIHPSLMMIDKTIESLSRLIGLPETTPIIITVDGLRNASDSTIQRLVRYNQALKKKYDKPHITILCEKKSIMLVGNVRKAMKLVDTEFVYLIQHDMPFISNVDHTALVQTFQSHPDEVRLVRFSPRKTLTRKRDRLGICGNVEFQANGIELSKTHKWSDQNHLTRKSYYDEMFSTIQGWERVNFMENKMADFGIQNCSYWGTYLYGRRNDGPMTVHLNGRLETNSTRLDGKGSDQWKTKWLLESKTVPIGKHGPMIVHSNGRRETNITRLP